MNTIGTSSTDQNAARSQITSEVSPSGTNSLEGSQPKKQILVLDGVRAIACLSVLFYHLNSMTDLWKSLNHIHTVAGLLIYVTATLAYAGDSGVILFFLLSGFLLFLPYAKALLFESPWPSLRCYYLRRVFRILPGYYAAIFLIALFFHPELLHVSHWPVLWVFLTFRMTHALSEHLNGPFWTLAIEFQFYLLLPIITWLFNLIIRHGTPRWQMFKLTLCLLAMVIWGLLTRYWGLFLANTSKLDFLIPHPVSATLQPYLYSDTGKYFEVFAVGMLLSMLYTYTQYAPSTEVWSIRIHRLCPLLFTIGLTLLFLLSFWYFYFRHIGVDVYNYSPHYASRIKHNHVFTSLNPQIPTIVYSFWPEWEALAYASSYGLCLLAVLYGSAKLKRPLEFSVLGWVASISFSLYMWHLPLLTFAKTILVHLHPRSWNPIVQYSYFWAWILIIIIPVSVILHRYIEQPSIRLSQELAYKLERSKEKSNVATQPS